MMKKLLIACLAVGLMATMASATTIIDHFQDPLGVTTVPVVNLGGPLPITTGPVSTVAPSAIGGQRIYNLTLIGGGLGENSTYQIVSAGSLHKMMYSNTSLASSTLDLHYDDGGSLNADLSADFAFNFQVIHADLGGACRITVVDTALNSSFVDTTIPGTTVNTDFQVAFAGFSGINFASVRSIDYLFSSPGSAFDLEIDSLSTTDLPGTPDVPEPATLLLLGLVGVPFIRRRLRRA